ncbi:MAG: hypothetical protein R3313_00190 [Candidatus Saccharimonadales bacterium]|nr:hypothetical protein [Candidatus Saccharimonadales bacterium]
MLAPDQPIARVNGVYVNEKEYGGPYSSRSKISLTPGVGVSHPDHVSLNGEVTVRVVHRRAAREIIKMLGLLPRDLDGYENDAGIFVARAVRAHAYLSSDDHTRIDDLEVGSRLWVPKENGPVLGYRSHWVMGIEDARHVLANHPHKPNLEAIETMTRGLSRQEVGFVAEVLEAGELNPDDELYFDQREVRK